MSIPSVVLSFDVFTVPLKQFLQKRYHSERIIAIKSLKVANISEISE